MATLTTAAASFRAAFTGEVADEIFRNSDPFSLFQSRPASGSTESWDLKTGAATGGTFAEGGAFSAAENNTYSIPALARGHWQATFSVTEDLEATMAISNARVFDAVGLEAAGALAAVYDQATTEMLGATGMGIQLAVDSTGTYAGLDHAAITGWNASENNLAGALTIAALQNALETLVNVERAQPGTAPDLLLTAPNQITNYLNLAGPGAGTSLVRYTRTGAGDASPANVGDERELAMFGTMPIQAVRDLTNTIWLMVKRDLFYIAFWNPSGAVNGILTQDVPKSGHQTETNIAMTAALVCRRPFHTHKETGVTA